MRGAALILGLVLTLGGGYFVYETQLTQLTSLQVSPAQQVDVVGVRSDLLVIALAERQYATANGAYATVDRLQQEGLIGFSGTDRRGYTYVAEVDGSRHFTITAAPSARDKTGWPTLCIDETMQVSQR